MSFSPWEEHLKVNKPSTPQLPDSANKDPCLPLTLPDGLDISIGMPTHINVKKIMKETHSLYSHKFIPASMQKVNKPLNTTTQPWRTHRDPPTHCT